MSSPAQGGAPAPKEEKEKKGFGKVLMRMKTVLKKATDSSRRHSTISAKGASSTTTPAKTETKESSAKAAAPPAKPTVEATKVPRAQIYKERAEKLGELYGLELKPSEWHSTEGHALRVEKPIRMRVHRKCHLCNSSFGLNKECTNCKHQRCKQCPRIPAKRTEAEKEESRKKRAAIIKERAENAPIAVDWNPNPKEIVLTRPAKKNGQDLVYRKTRQRIRRVCCQCEKLFIGSKTCQGCQHVCCTDCTRDPCKKEKYPYGYPGDAPGAKTRHYKCGTCNHSFSIPATAPVACTKCSSAKCDREMPRKVEPEPDPEVLKSIQARMEALSLKTAANK
ncbi:hypothetical protein N0V88_002884 [Collariella sp. IMI 366227]|nr:hypothetical protein N0V88_002884 [Collariella sp. IMI 366227]